MQGIFLVSFFADAFRIFMNYGKILPSKVQRKAEMENEETVTSEGNEEVMYFVTPMTF